MERPQQPTLECKKSFEVEEPLDVNTPDLLVSSWTLKNKRDISLSIYQLFSFAYSGSDSTTILSLFVSTSYIVMT